MAKRIFDIFFSILGLIFIFPILIIIGLIIKLDSKGNAFYLQERIGKNGKPFKIYKFRTMYLNSDKKGMLSLGKNDNRITKIGHFLRKFKLDELPQLINVLKGEMSFVGPRPEVQKYVDLYTKEQLKILNVKPGITDLASIHFFEEEQLLGKSHNPEKTYITEILPKKIKLNKEYLKNVTLTNDIKIIIKTVYKILKR
jgi:lipopolysaccharide/colanic/teichoic acid biosynthesis glycosyltransferase